MVKPIPSSYMTLTEAAGLLGETETSLIRAAGNGYIRLCVNIYGRADKMKSTRMNPESEQTDGSWRASSAAVMPDGIFEIGEDTARFLEMPEHKKFKLFDALKINDLGWWNVEFESPVAISRTDIVMMREEVERIQEPTSTHRNKPLGAKERGSLLTIIGALAEAANIDLSKPHKAGQTLEAMLSQKGVKLGARTIGDHLKDVRNAMDSRKK